MKESRKFAAHTDVSTEKSRLDLQRLLDRYECASQAMLKHGSQIALIFEAHGRRVRFMMNEATSADLPKQPSRGRRINQRAWIEQETRRRWRLLLMSIQVRLELVANGADFETEFAGYLVTPSGQTVAEILKPQLEEMYAHGRMPSLLALAGPRYTQEPSNE